MLYVLAFIFPPLAVLGAGKPFQGICNLVVYLIGLVTIFAFGLGLIVCFLCLVHALVAASGYYADDRQRRLVYALGNGGRQLKGSADDSFFKGVAVAMVLGGLVLGSLVGLWYGLIWVGMPENQAKVNEFVASIQAKLK